MKYYYLMSRYVLTLFVVLGILVLIAGEFVSTLNVWVFVAGYSSAGDFRLDVAFLGASVHAAFERRAHFL